MSLCWENAYNDFVNLLVVYVVAKDLMALVPGWSPMGEEKNLEINCEIKREKKRDFRLGDNALA